ncbi:MAG: hypothetical protein HKN17_07440 [Rhodothermales bacterium]|nr:hypothetical protein [Rhodothermales bacterium]
MTKGMRQQELAVQSGYWPLYRYDPRRTDSGGNPLQLDSKAPTIPFKEYAYNENRYRMLTRIDPEAAASFLAEAQRLVTDRWKAYERLAAPVGGDGAPSAGPAPPQPASGPANTANDGASDTAPATGTRKPKMPPGFGG